MRWRSAIKVSLDGAGWAFGLFIAIVVRYDFHLTRQALEGLLILLPLVVMAQVVVGVGGGLYTERWVFGSFEEVAALTGCVALTTVGVVGLDVWLGNPRTVALSAVLAGGFIALVWMCAARYSWRLSRESRHRPDSNNAHRIIIFGAGDGGAQVVRAMMHDHRGRYLPVALLDDDPRKRNLRISGVPVVGGRHTLLSACRQYRARSLLIAIPSADAALIRETSSLADSAGLEVKVLPSVSQLLGEGVRIGDIRSVTLADVLGRREIHTDVESIAGYLKDKRVLVTGAGGSIGSELCRQIRRFAPAKLITLDRDESALHALQLSLGVKSPLDWPDVVVADIRDSSCLRQVFDRYEPEVVFHAAALKHLTLLERYPGEAVRTNVWGTLNLLRAAAEAGVEYFVNVSTDKAADPCSILGYTKRTTERLTAYMGNEARGTYLSVRFGNVLGSRGSVLTTFEAQLASGGPITVTDPDVARFFMTTEEAVQLLIQAGAIGRDGEVLVLDMGELVRIDDVARRLAAGADRPVDVVYTGLRPGEKLHEVLLGRDEIDKRPVHPLISHVDVPTLHPEQALDLDPLAVPPALAVTLRALSISDVPASLVGRQP
jgi:FlaA1/EpsC-like NDP-sugar epimerase